MKASKGVAFAWAKNSCMFIPRAKKQGGCSLFAHIRLFGAFCLLFKWFVQQPHFPHGFYKELVAVQPGDVPITYADTSALERDFGFKPSTTLRDGLRAFAEWYKKFYKV